MATLDPTARPSHRPGYVQIDVPTPECTLSTVAPIGAHLVIQATIAQARRLHDKLSRALGELDKPDE
jgi:hypothetical protein